SDGYAAAAYWSNAIKVNGVSSINFDGVVVPGTGAIAGNGVDVEGLPSSTACSGGPCYGVQYNFVNCTFNFGSVGITYGNYVQGVAVANSNFTGGHFGIFSNTSQTGVLAQLSVANSQFANTNAAISLNTNVSGVLVTSSVFISSSASSTGINGIMNEFSILGNLFTASSTSGTFAVSAASGSAFGVITGNDFVSYGTAINIANTASPVNVQSNEYTGNTTNTVPAATTGAVKIGGGSA
ncbi:hypothetical protein, partial [Mesorhizobium sp. P5_C1]